MYKRQTDESIANATSKVGLNFEDIEKIRIENEQALIDEIKLALSGLLDPTINEKIIGNAEVKEVFYISKVGKVAGCMVIEGSIFKSKPVRVLRDDVVIHQGELDSLRRFKDDVGEVKSGTECGVGIKNYKDIRPGDKVEVFDRKEEAQSIS